MNHYQDTETGQIYAFDKGIDPHALNNRNIPETLSEDVKTKPDDSYIWHHGDWIKKVEAPIGYTQPISSVPSYNPAWMAYLLPYTAVHRDESSGLNISLEQINENSYDGNKLSIVVASLPLNTPSGICGLISYDGAIAIPQCEDFPCSADGVNKLNEMLCSFLLGGVHTEILHTDDLVIGSLHDKAKLFAYTPSLHSQLRLNWAAVNERIAPLMHPRVLMLVEMQDAYRQGQQVIQSIHNFSPFFLLNGYTAMHYRNNGDALNNLWITVEQLTEYLWAEFYEKNFATFPVRIVKCHNHLKSRKQLRNIWAKQQQLRLSKIISKKCHVSLNNARNMRNDLVHDGVVPNLEIIKGLWNVIPELLEVASNIQQLGLRKLSGAGASSWNIPVKTNFDEWMQLSQSLLKL